MTTGAGPERRSEAVSVSDEDAVKKILTESILGPGAVVGAGAVVQGAVLAEGASVPPGTSSEGARVGAGQVLER